MTIRVLLADDEPLIRAGVRAILSTDTEIDVVAEAGDGREAVELARLHRPHIALLDIRMPRLDGLGTAAELATAVPSAKVVLLTTFDEDDYVDAALAHGVDGFLLKAADPRELLLGIRAVANGAAFLSPRIARKVIARFGAAAPAGTAARLRLDVLTAREREVLGLLGRGLSNADIGRALFLAEATVKFHVSAILRRLCLDNRVQAAILAHEAGLTRADRPAPG
ncbi:response regulator transcription factor [Nocardia neocaledoniensis]|uniref:response regulator transcription factor n=1 Tax=Nocardia neocaledoniensis TaxID=236511 RepID=UPI0024590E88|nr:response regulator transcription factor [Nocardia neocaledoniensis]